MEEHWMNLLQETHDSALRSEEKVIGLAQTCGKTEIHLAALNGHVDDHAKKIAGIDKRVVRNEVKLWIVFIIIIACIYAIVSNLFGV